MSKFFSHKASHKGFTLIELLVVIAIIGILSSVVLASLNSARTKARDARRVADLKQVQVALELYYDANSAYPTSLTALVGSGLGASLPTLPVDPRGVTATMNATGGYKYAINAGATAYHVGATLEQAPTQTTLDDGDRDFDSSAAALSPAWTTDGVNSIPFKGDADATAVVYDISNQ